MKIGNALVKGLKVAGQTVAGVVGFGLLAAAAPDGWKPGPDAPAVVAMLWYTVGAGLASGAGAALVRWATYKPHLDPTIPQ